ncbi:MAG TPA: flavin reductase, partial [Bacteroidia bacterium]|nr:flavin reductase [Bacteroidia bacterium]
MEIDKQTLSTYDRFYRGNLINSLSGFKPASLIGTSDDQGRTNLAIFSNIVHLGADPALVGFVNRPMEAAPHTISNIESTGWYTINLIPASLSLKAHQTSAKYGPGQSEFDAVGFTPQWKDGIPAPFVRECKVKFALKLQEIIPIKWNQTFFVIGSIEHLIVEEVILEEDGFL